MRFKVWGDNLPTLTINAETANSALLEARMVNQGYLGVTPVGNTAQDKYNKNSTKLVAFRFNKEKDKDILDHLDSLSNKTEYIRQLIRRDIS